MTFDKIIRSIYRLFNKRKSYHKIEIKDNVSPIDSINSSTIALYRKNGQFSWARFKCPCGCGHMITISLNPDIMPFWKVQVHTMNGRNTVTFLPSIWITMPKCSAHFYIRNSKVYWV